MPRVNHKRVKWKFSAKFWRIEYAKLPQPILFISDYTIVIIPIQFGALSYNRNPKIEFTLGEFPDADSTLSAVDRISFEGKSATNRKIIGPHKSVQHFISRICSSRSRNGAAENLTSHFHWCDRVFGVVPGTSLVKVTTEGSIFSSNTTAASEIYTRERWEAVHFRPAHYMWFSSASHKINSSFGF